MGVLTKQGILSSFYPDGRLELSIGGNKDYYIRMSENHMYHLPSEWITISDKGQDINIYPNILWQMHASPTRDGRNSSTIYEFIVWKRGECFYNKRMLDLSYNQEFIHDTFLLIAAYN